MQVGSFVCGVGAARTGGPEADSRDWRCGGCVGGGVEFQRCMEELYRAKLECTREQLSGSGRWSWSYRDCSRACSTDIEAGVTLAMSE